MKLRNSVSVKRSLNLKIRKESCRKFSEEKLSVKIVNSLKFLYKDLKTALMKLEIMLPYEISLKNLASMLNTLRISYSIDDLKQFLIFHSEDNGNSLRFPKLVEVLQAAEAKSELTYSPFKDEGTSTADLTQTSGYLDLSQFRALLSNSLTYEFDNYIDAFKSSTSTNSITYFNLIKLLNRLKIQYSEPHLSQILNKLSLNGHITLDIFKGLFYNDDELCTIQGCLNTKESISKYCKVHLIKIKAKGKTVINSILQGVDGRTARVLKVKLKALLFPSVKEVKNLLKGYSRNCYSKNEWKCMQIYVGEKKKEDNECLGLFKKSPSVSGFRCKSLQRNEKSSLRCFKTIAHTEDTVFITSFAQ